MQELHRSLAILLGSQMYRGRQILRYRLIVAAGALSGRAEHPHDDSYAGQPCN
jgi:hypothetical protein